MSHAKLDLGWLGVDFDGIAEVIRKATTNGHPKLDLGRFCPANADVIAKPHKPDAHGNRVDLASYRNFGGSVTLEVMFVEKVTLWFCAMRNDIVYLKYAQNVGMDAVIVQLMGETRPGYTLPIQITS